MGERSEILDALAKWSTSTVLAVALCAMVWMDHHDEHNWDTRIEDIMERHAAAQERHEEHARRLANTLVQLLERHQ